MTPVLSRPWLVLAGLALGVTVTNGFARFAYGLILPAMRLDMDWSYAQAGWLNTANALGYIAGAILTMLVIRSVPAPRLFVFGMVATTLSLLATGLNAALWWQTVFRILAGVFGAMSFSTSGALAASLFQDSPRKNALAIGLLFGSGGGFAIVLAGGTLPMMLEASGPQAWPNAWLVIGGISLCFLPLSIWSAAQLRSNVQGAPKPVPLPIRRMLPLMAGYAGFGLGYIVYLTFLSAWMTEHQATAGFISVVWVLLGVCVCASPFVWRPVLARHASGLPLALILLCIALGSALPVLLPGRPALLASAVIVGISVFMAPPAVTNFSRQNLPGESWGHAISVFTVVFAVAQTLGPYSAGLLGDLTGNIGYSLLTAAGLLTLGAGFAMAQKPLPRSAVS